MNRRALAAGLVVSLAAAGTAPVFGQPQQAVGAITGQATDEAKKPYTNYTVQLRDTETGQVVDTVPLNAAGLFSFNNLQLSRKFLVELYQVHDRKIVCTEGPYSLTPSATALSGVNIDCGATPASLWLLAAATGAVAGIAIVTESGSQ